MYMLMISWGETQAGGGKSQCAPPLYATLRTYLILCMLKNNLILKKTSDLLVKVVTHPIETHYENSKNANFNLIIRCIRITTVATNTGQCEWGKHRTV